MDTFVYRLFVKKQENYVSIHLFLNVPFCLLVHFQEIHGQEVSI